MGLSASETGQPTFRLPNKAPPDTSTIYCPILANQRHVFRFASFFHEACSALTILRFENTSLSRPAFGQSSQLGPTARPPP